MRWQYTLASVALLLTPSTAIFSDDAFDIDYHQALLGIPQSHTTFFHKPQSSSNASLLYTISDKAVLGAVNPRDGSLVWRQALAGQPVERAAASFLAAGDADGRVTSGFQSAVSSWDALDGRLNWVHNFGQDQSVKGLQTVPTVVQEAENIIQDIIAVAAPATAGSGASVVRIAGDGTAARWEYQDKSATQDTSFSLVTSPKHVYYITKSSGLISGGKAKVVIVDIATGKEVSQYSVAVDSETLGPSLSVASGTEASFLVSSEKPYKSFKFNLLGKSKSSTVTLEDKGEEVTGLSVHSVGSAGSAAHFLVHVSGKTKQWAEVFHIDTKNGEVTRAYTLPATAETSTFSATAVGPAVYFTRITDTEVSLYSSESHGHFGRWSRNIPGTQFQSQVLHACTEVSTRGANGVALRVALSSSESGWSLIRNGEEAWLRAEALAYINKAIWADDAAVVSLAHEIEVEAASNPVTAYVHRLTRHIQDFRYLPQYILGIPGSIFQNTEEANKSTRDKLVGTKLILATTSRGEALALDATGSGIIRWRTKLAEIGKPIVQAVYIAATEGRLTVYLADGQIVVVDVASGKILSRQKGTKSFHKIIELPGESASTIVRVSEAGKPEVFTDLAPAVPTEGSIIVTVNEKGDAIGWSVGSTVKQIWTLHPDNGAKITDVIGRAAHDPVASIGKVLGDRSVLYKYINPNVALLTALSSTALTVYIINSVTGSVMHTATHEGVLDTLPISAVAAGHKFVYSFTLREPASSGLSSQIIVSELFEAESSNDRGLLQSRSNYSSFSPDAGAKPWVESKAFTVAEPLSHLTVSQTGQGITARQVLAYLAESHSVIGIPSDPLNARRPVDRDATALELEEGLIRYSPILELDSKFFLSHTQDVLGLQKLMTAPTLLESTSLVFGFGHDIFGTQVAPSSTFDVLGKGFKRIQLVLTVVALYAGVLAVRPIVRSKMVERRWS